MKDFLIKILSVSLIIAILDSVFLGLIIGMFKKSILNIQGEKLNVRLIPSTVGYIFLISIFYYFVLVKKLNLFESFLLGLGIYGIYELTNYSTINKWPLRLVFIDTLWGGTLFFLTLLILKTLKVVK